MKNQLSTVVASLTLIFGLFPGNVFAFACLTNEACEIDSYCQKSTGNCSDVGDCELKPTMCPDVWAPVCGCDGKTYGNGCEAASAGVSVASQGECSLPSACQTNEDCGIDSYCQKSTGNCSEVGGCELKPVICPDVWAPVCGCDGKTYGNSCEAASAGVSISSQGECAVPGDDFPWEIFLPAFTMNSDIDGDGFGRNQGDCDDSNPDVYPGAPIVCDNDLDHNCDGTPDNVSCIPIHYYTTCGDPVCRPYTPSGIPICTPTQIEGNLCYNEGEICDPQWGCNVLIICAPEDPKLNGCPI
jgi:hypothetical protein